MNASTVVSLLAISHGAPLLVCAGQWVRLQVRDRARAAKAEEQRLTEWLPGLERARPVLVRRGDTGQWLRLTEVTGKPGRHRAEG